MCLDDNSDDLVVGRWLDGTLPADDKDLLLVWDRRTAALVPRGLFISRWDDFWYPSSDDLTIVGVGGSWRLQMSHYGSFEFFGPDAG